MKIYLLMGRWDYEGDDLLMGRWDYEGDDIIAAFSSMDKLKVYRDKNLEDNCPFGYDSIYSKEVEVDKED